MKKAVAATTADINRFMLTDMEEVNSNATIFQNKIPYSKKENHHGSIGNSHHNNGHKIESSNRNSEMNRSADSVGSDDILGAISTSHIFNVMTAPVVSNGQSLFSALKQQLPVYDSNIN